MPYNNSYNKKISDEMYQQDKTYIEHLDSEALKPLYLSGGGMSGGKMVNLQDKYIEDVLRGGCMNCGCQPMCRQIGGSGYGKATWKDDGYGREMGLGTVELFKPKPNSKGGVKEMKKEDSKICYVGVGSGAKEFRDDVKSFDWNRTKDWLGLGKHLKMTGKGWDEFKKDLSNFNFNTVKSWIGLGKYGKANTKRMLGAGFWEDFKRGFNMVFEPGSKYIVKPLATATGLLPLTAGLTALGYGKAKRGRKSKMGAGLLNMPFQDRIARPDEAWKLKIERDRRFQPKEEIMAMEGSGTKELQDDIKAFDWNRAKVWLGMAKPKDMMALKKHTGLTGKGWDEFKKDLSSFNFNTVKSWIGLGKYGKANTKRMLGSGWWDSFTNFFKKFPEKMNEIIMPIASKITDVVTPFANKITDAVGTVKGAVGLGKKAPSAKQLEARRKFTEMVRQKAMKKLK